MCGIIGAVAQRDISDILLEGLRRLEYRGYDSAGLVTIDIHGEMKRLRTEGKVQALINKVQEDPIPGQIGVAHTRWATHGRPAERNAHPILSRQEIAVVHNGIIENHQELRHMLIGKGYEFTSETDTEVAAHLIHHCYQQTKELLSAVQMAAKEMQGAFALGVMHLFHPDELIAIRKGSPLVVGIGTSENYIASDALALRAFAKKVIYLDEGDVACLTSKTYQIYDKNGLLVEREPMPLPDDDVSVSKGEYRHFMLKEIYEQAHVLKEMQTGRVLNPTVVRSSFGVRFNEIIHDIRHIHIVACGTSYHAGLIAKYWLETYAGIGVQVEVASEYRYRQVVVNPNTLLVTISQSGETADTLAALRKAKEMNYLATLAICNVASSTLVRESDSAFLTRAGVEIGVASTKAFTSQLLAMLLLTAALSDDAAQYILQEIKDIDTYCQSALGLNNLIERHAKEFIQKQHTLFLGRGIFYPVALEGALKLKEISYIHAEAYPAGELKHGPLALVDHHMPVVVLAPKDALMEKLQSNVQEVQARGGKILLFADESWPVSELSADMIVIKVPECPVIMAPIIYSIPMQLLAYYVAVAKGTDVDQPRNLAKSVTVE